MGVVLWVRTFPLVLCHAEPGFSVGRRRGDTRSEEPTTRFLVSDLLGSSRLPGKPPPGSLGS